MNNEELERQLLLKQLQINRLLDITQAINNNVKAEGLFDMYKSFLNWELGVRRMALFVPHEKSWACATYVGIEEKILKQDVLQLLPTFGSNIKKIERKDTATHSFLSEFDMVIPVFHKDEPIAYAFVGGYEAPDFSKIQLITTMTNIVAVAIENKRLFKQQLEQARFNQEIQLASEMQRTLIPSTLPTNGCFEVSAIYQPHFGVGGDYYDCFHYDDGRYLFVVADIAGKGLAASLLMANFQANLHALVPRCDSPEDLVRQINTAVHRITKSDKYLTFFACEFDTKTRLMRYVNAGHIPPVLVMGDSSQYLVKGCTILGYFEQLPPIEVGEVFIEDDALLCIFTDGITDIKDPDGSYFNEEILLNFVKENALLTAEEFNETLMNKIHSFKGDEDFPDDMTVLTCRFQNTL